MLKNTSATAIRATLAGMIIGIGGTIFLTTESNYLGAFLFSIGLFTIYTLKLYLFTGKVGFVFEEKNPFDIIIIWLGNFLGCFIMAKLVSATRIASSEIFINNIEKYISIKLVDTTGSLFFLGVFCGTLMYIGAAVYKKCIDTKNSFGAYFGMVLAVMVFILAGSEHSIANMFYFSVGNVWGPQAFVSTLVVTLGNTIGGLLFPTLIRICKKLDS